MKTTIRYCGPLVAGAILWMAGCTQTPPTTPSDKQAGPPRATRSLMDVDTQAVEPIDEAQAKQLLPARISVADAKNMLVPVDKGMISDEKATYSLQHHGGHGGWHGGHGFHHGFGRFSSFGFGWGGWPWYGYGLGLGAYSLYSYLWPGYGYYGLGDYYYPYSLYGNYYYPMSYYPYLYRYRRLFYPFSYYV